MDAARQVALNWTFLMDTLDMSFDELYPLFKAWCESLPEDKMAEIMATAEALSDEDDDDILHTEAEIWGDVDGVPTVEHPTKKRPKGGWRPSGN